MLWGGAYAPNTPNDMNASDRKKSRKAPPRDVFWATWPLFLVGRVLGLAPFPLEYGRGRVETSSLLVNYSRFAWLFAVSFSVSCLPEMVEVQLHESTQKSVPINAYVNAAWWIMCVLLGAAAFSCFYLRRERLHFFLLELARFDSDCMLERSLHHRRTRRLLLLHFFGLLILVFLAILHQVYSVLTQSLQDSNELTLLGLYWLLVIIVLDSQFFILAWVVRERFRLVNDGVSHVVASECPSARARVTAIGIGEDIRSSRLIRGSKMARGKAVAAYVRVLASFDMSLFHLVRQLCDAYGPMVLVQTCSNLVQITFHIYYYIEEVMGLINSDDTVYVVGDLAVWCCPYMIGISMVLASSHVTTKEADQTGVLVSEALLRVKDHQARRELRLFSHQLLHTKVRFTACGFFSLDFSLLTSMTAAVVTHLVILVQFQLAGKENQTNCTCTQDNTTAMTTIPTTPLP